MAHNDLLLSKTKYDGSHAAWGTAVLGHFFGVSSDISQMYF